MIGHWEISSTCVFRTGIFDAISAVIAWIYIRNGLCSAVTVLILHEILILSCEINKVFYYVAEVKAQNLTTKKKLPTQPNNHLNIHNPIRLYIYRAGNSPLTPRPNIVFHR